MADTYFKNLDDDSKKKYVSQVLERCKQVWGVDELHEIEDENGDLKEANLDGMMSRAFQHEYDH